MLSPASRESYPVADVGFDKEETLADLHIADLIVLSFRYSQGSIHLGNRLLAYVVQAHKEQFPSGRIPERAIELAVPIVQSIRHHGHPEYTAKLQADSSLLRQPLPPKTVRRAIDRQVENMGHYPETQPEIELPTIAGLILQRDAHFLLDAEPRSGREQPGRLSAGKAQAINATFLSHYCFYGLAGRPAGPIEYNEIFADISSPASIRSLPATKIPFFEAVDNENIVETEIDFDMDRFERVMLVHFKHNPGDLDKITEAKKAALGEVVNEVTAAALGL